jgi:tetratricopeptide (TPR) repeat protein
MTTLRSPRGLLRFLCSIVAVSMAILQPAHGQGVSAELGKPIAAAQDAIAKSEWTLAYGHIDAARTAATTPRDAYIVDSVLLHALDGQKKYDDAAKVQARMLASGQIPPEQLDAQTRNMSRLHFIARKYKEAIAWADKVLEKHPDDRWMLNLAMNSHFQLRDYKNAASAAAKLIAAAERAGQTPEQAWLRTAQYSYHQLGDGAGERRMLIELVKHYQTPADWEALLDSFAVRVRGDAMKLAYYRLMFDVGVLKRPEDYVELTQLAMDMGAGTQAQRIMERGFQNDHLNSESETEQSRYRRLVAKAKVMSAELPALLTKLESEAAAANDGLAYMQLGHLYMSTGAYAKAITAFKNGMGKGVYDPDQAKLDLAIAYAQARQRDRALKALRAVERDSKWAALAELWRLRV